MISRDEAAHEAGEDAAEEIEWVSKSQLKRDSKALQDLGKQLAGYNAAKLATLPLDEGLKDAIALAQKLHNKRSAQKRQFQFIGKLLRSLDVEPILEAVDRIENADRYDRLRFKLSEQWRDRILSKGDPAIQALCEQYPELQRQALRQIWRNWRQAGSDERKTRYARQLFKAIAPSIQAP
jgi:ribosome-associated protein